ncbi:MAG TPA: YciI family protein [Terriglobales bacterium]|jgi:hypothetical protein|nr:YciI family protein [Terriglobales bacterium]
MAQYLLLLYANPADWMKFSPEEMQKAIEKYVAWGMKASQSGFLKGSHKLTNDVGKVLRGKTNARVTDGPYSETKEVLGGYYLIEASDYNQAVERSKDHPHLGFGGTIEVREVDNLGG